MNWVRERASLLAVVAAGGALIVVVPAVAEIFLLFELTLFLVLAILALSLAWVWGFGGILCFGQSVFFGLGGYTYAIAVINMGDSTVPLMLGILLPALLAGILGYFLFWQRISDVYLAVITLAVSLIFYYLTGASAGSEYRIGSALLGGYNGIPSVPPINVPGVPEHQVVYGDLYVLTAVMLAVVYGGLRWLLATDFGRVVVAVRENEERAQLLGYDVRITKLTVFVIGGAIAGLSGVLFAAWGSYVSPNVFSMTFTAQIIVWVLVGGLGTLSGAVVGCVLVQAVMTWLGEAKLADTNLVLGAAFVVLVLFARRGLVPGTRSLLADLRGRVRSAP
ncbi:MAG: branched-chain amino acid ABC transporter permease [Rhodospirillales bacterium]|nr:branched-chain amino acid ABC transporter permease [Rhodospirillales bacterium]MDE0712076.1 branched-chain amino acid ABC transporter permease [Rhodospirillales bacterium]